MLKKIELNDEDLRLIREGALLIPMSEADLRLLREAAAEFIEVRNRGPNGVQDYVAYRYELASREEQGQHIARVTERVQRMLHILEKVLVIDGV